LSKELFAKRLPGPPDAQAVAFVRPLVEKASLALSVNEAWALLAWVAILGLLLVPLAREKSS
jgi:DHA2 family multidrug resistance protein